MNRLLACALAAVLASCAPQGPRTDEFSDHVTIDSAHATDASLLGPNAEWELQSTVGKAAPHAVGHRLLVWIELRSAPRLLTKGVPEENIRYRFANDDTAAPLPVVPIVDAKCRFGDQTCTTTQQTIAVPVPDAALRAHVVKGYRVKVTPNDGDPIILSLAPALLAKQLTEVDTLVQGDAAIPRAPANAPHLGIGVIAASATPFADPPQGVIVVAIVPSSPAAAAGIEPGDVLHAIGPEPVRASGDLARIMAGIAPGSTVSLALERGGKPFTASVQL
jgi:PDZ domain